MHETNALLQMCFANTWDVCSNHLPLHAARWLRLRHSAAQWKVSWRRQIWDFSSWDTSDFLGQPKWTVNGWWFWYPEYQNIICNFHRGRFSNSYWGKYVLQWYILERFAVLTSQNWGKCPSWRVFLLTGWKHHVENHFEGSCLKLL